MMKLVKAAGAIVLCFYVCNAGGVLATNNADMDIQHEEVQVASEGNIINWDAKVVKATGKHQGERGEVPAGRALKSPKSPKSSKSSKSSKASKSCKASKSSESSPTINIDGWNAANEEVYEALVDADATGVDFTVDSGVSTLDFDYEWFGTTFSKICLSSNGYITIGESCNLEFGYIAFVDANLNPPSGSVKYLKKSSTCSLKISFEDVKFDGGNGNVQAQIELFENGDILICYGLGDLAGNGIFALVQDSNPVVYRIEDPPFSDGFTRVWPECKCWKFKMPQTPS